MMCDHTCSSRDVSGPEVFVDSLMAIIPSRREMVVISTEGQFDVNALDRNGDSFNIWGSICWF